jgi:hypothetical protein
MAQNLFTDFPERVDQLKKYCELTGQLFFIYISLLI